VKLYFHLVVKDLQGQWEQPEESAHEDQLVNPAQRAHLVLEVAVFQLLLDRLDREEQLAQPDQPELHQLLQDQRDQQD
jgi:hypothetical protein